MTKTAIVKKPHIDYLKVIAALFVVVGHCITYLQENYMPEIPVWGTWIGVLVSSVHVPLFFLIAGYLCHRQPYGGYMLKKVTRLLVPYIVFALLKKAFSIVTGGGLAHGANIAEWLYDTFVLGGAYWFIYCMFIIYLIAPIGWRGEKTSLRAYNVRLMLLIAALMAFNIITTDYMGGIFPAEWKMGGFTAATPLFQVERVLLYLPYFLFGMLIKQNEELFLKITRKGKLLIIPAALALTVWLGYLVVYGITMKGFIVKMGIAFSLMLLLYYFAKALPRGIKPIRAASAYTLHVMFFDSIYRVVLFKAAENVMMSPNLPVSLLIAVIVVILACVTSFIISKIPFVRRLFGL